MKLEVLQDIALASASERSFEKVLARIVEGLHRQPEVALARVWLLGPGDSCATCRMASSCDDRSRCLHLVASAGTPRSVDADWSRLDGSFRRVPLSSKKVGAIAATGAGTLINDVKSEKWADRDWVAREGIRSFAGHPLVFRGETLGVLAVFRRSPMDDQDFRLLGAFANQAAVAIANARALEEVERLQRRLEQENAYLREEVETALAFGSIVGRSRPLRRVLKQIEMVAPTDATVLIVGESGTGKELVAREIHERGRRSGRALIRVNCSAVPRDMFESEFFGHVRGAFTGALKDRPGRFQLADGGTLLLDEIGDLPLELQPKMLRVLQEGQYERVGEDVTRSVNVRVLAATNRDLEGLVRSGRFREDLYYRLSAFPLEVPALRERTDDIPALAAHFVELSARRLGIHPPRVPIEEYERLKEYAWPGNVRELQNVVERAVILSQGGRLRMEVRPGRAAMSGGAASDVRGGGGAAVIPHREWRRMERENLLAALKVSGGRVYGPRGAAEILGVKPSTLTSRLKAFKINVRAGSG